MKMKRRERSWGHQPLISAYRTRSKIAIPAWRYLVNDGHLRSGGYSQRSMKLLDD